MKALLLLHPLGVDHKFWDQIRAHVGNTEVVAPDILGHGSAGADGSASIAEMAARIADTLPADQSFCVVGMSLGGLVAQQLAIDAPDSVDSLVLIDTLAVYPNGFRATWQDRADAVRSRGMEAVIEPTLGSWFTPAALQEDGAVVQYVRQALSDATREGYALACEALGAADTSAELQGITVRSLVLCGEDDREAFREGAIDLHTALPNAELAWLPGQHAAILENPKEFVHLLTEFNRLDSVPHR